MREEYHFIVSRLQKLYSSRGSTANGSAELVNYAINVVGYILRDQISKKRYWEWYDELSSIPNNVSEQLLEDAIRWGTILKDIVGLYSCYSASIECYTCTLREFPYYLDYIEQGGFFAGCAVEHVTQNIRTIIQSGSMDVSYINDMQALLDIAIQEPSVENMTKLFSCTKKSFVTYLKKQPAQLFRASDVYDFIKNGWCEPHELEKIIPIDIIQKCLDGGRVYQMEPECSASPVSGGVDVYFLGAPGTGKSCLISGLLSAANDLPEALVLNNDYAYRLISKHKDGEIVSYTPYHTVVPLGVTINEKRSKTLFNIIEMDGASIGEIACSDGYCFNDMDFKAVSSIINYNLKILFFIFDPTKVKDVCYGYSMGEFGYCRCRQWEILDRMIALFDHNEDVMKNVLAIHIIVMKSDTQPQGESAYEFLESGWYAEIKRICKRYDINRKHNYTPMIVPFSVGKFYTTEFFVPESEYSKNLLNIISESIRDTGMKRLVNKIHRLFRK